MSVETPQQFTSVAFLIKSMAILLRYVFFKVPQFCFIEGLAKAKVTTLKYTIPYLQDSHKDPTALHCAYLTG